MSTCGSGVARWLLLGALLPGVPHAQESCRCNFGSGQYTAIGTKAACNAFVFDDKHCEVAFSAIGGNPAVLDFIKAPVSEDEAYALTLLHVAALRKHDYETLSNEAFLSKALPVLMRATYARESVKGGYPLAELDRVAMTFLAKETPLVARVFAGKEKPVQGELEAGYRFAIDVGRVVLTGPRAARLTVVVFTPEKR